ncbi:MAG TPA: diacylglycerol kinase family protein, partial [Chryseosolibacter sp.]
AGPGHATTLAAQAAAEGFKKVVAVGGDGTVNEVAQALLHSPVAMGIVPKGSGNGLARHLRIPLNITSALRCLFTSEAIAMDTLRINGKLSLNVSGIGFDGYIANLFGGDNQRGLRGYTRLMLREFRRFREFEAHLRMGEGNVDTSAFVIAIANSSQYGNNARIAPAASVRDALFNVSILKKIPPYRLDFIYQLFSGTIDQSAYCRVIATREATVTLPAPMYFHADGEPCGKADRFLIEMVPASLHMLSPCEAKML